MAKSTQLTLFLLLASAASAAAGGNPSTGVDAACAKTLYPDFCEMMLMPAAAEFADHDPKKMGSAALGATIQKVKSLKSFMEGQATKEAKSNELKAAIAECVEEVGRTETSLQSALTELDSPKGEAAEMGNGDPATKIDAATADLNTCLEALKKARAAAGKPEATGVSADVSHMAVRSTNETVFACYIAKNFVVMH